ncbi:hypothetical protein CC86DRAFT_197244 [Ophiobolus disseminans]|uniref:Uncharacterized protein n=1 Tax=Ophiobolus disseminans TaxID=1469910 RepID=A0A6A7A603_9PLEO|nr:hypothetical protein CC86DRAFT_197244 [Ophiobolus disseminans]
MLTWYASLDIFSRRVSWRTQIVHQGLVPRHEPIHHVHHHHHHLHFLLPVVIALVHSSPWSRFQHLPARSS